MVSDRIFVAYRDPDGRERVYPLRDPLMVGRSEKCHVMIDMEGISRRHCLLSLVESKVVIEDLDSTNGTYLNGTRIREAVVRPGDKIMVGSCSLYILTGGDAKRVADSGQTQLLGQTTIETLLNEDEESLPDPVMLSHAGLKGSALEAMFNLSEIANSSRDMDSLLNGSLSLLMDLLHMDLGCVYRSGTPEEPPELLVAVNISPHGKYDPSTSVIKKVLEENVSVIATDVIGSDGIFKSRSITESGTACIMCVPMRSAGIVKGAIYLSSLKQIAPLKEGALRLLTAMATQVGLAMENLAHLGRLKMDNLALRSELGVASDLVGSSRAIQKVNILIDKVAATDATVLITGESGTGKELVAHAVHNRSNRYGRPMVSLNCGAIPETMVESELFGHERGAFTGATDRKIGKFELASEGTLFLDEIGELSLGTQVKLLRALEQRNFYRVGGDELVKVDVRIIAATNADLDEKKRQGQFRNDLLYRLKVFIIHVPPLRERPGDVPLLVRHILDQLGGERIFQISKEAMERLGAYSWPGNVRELRNVLERAIILAEGSELMLEHFDSAATGDFGSVSPRASLKEAEAVHVLRVLQSVDWNKKAAAEVLGIGRPTLYDKMKQFGIKEGD